MDDKVVMIQKMCNDSYLAILKDEYRLDGSSIVEAGTIEELTQKLDNVERADDRWVTMNGAHVLLNGNGRIIGGAGGKFNGMRFGTRFSDYALNRRAKKGKYAGRVIVHAHPTLSRTEPESIVAFGQNKNRRSIKDMERRIEARKVPRLAISRAGAVNARTKKRGGGTLNAKEAGREQNKRIISGIAASKDNVIKGASKAAQRAYDKARRAEPKITKDLVDISNELGMSMTGLQYSVKTASSVSSKIKRKIADKRRKGATAKDYEIVREMGDLVRYTQMGNHDDLGVNTLKAIKALEARGHKVTKVENKYLDKSSDYKGIHLDVKSPSGQKYELQIHSKESMAVKNKLHPIYEKSRMLPPNSPERKRLEQQMRDISASLPMPKGIENLQNRG